MKEMLSSYTPAIFREENTEDIRKTLKTIKKNVAKGQQIRRLHFSFSGHGGSDQNEQCLVGTGGKLIFHSELINLLLEFGSETITTTYDCCRGWARPGRSTRGSSPNKGPFSKMSNRENIFEIYATVEDHKSYDDNSLTKELSKVTEKGKKPILIRNISGEVNDSWLDRGITNQASQGITIDRGSNWRDFMWPTGTAKEEEIQKEKKASEPTMTDLFNAINQTKQTIQTINQTINKNTETINKNTEAITKNTETTNKNTERVEKLEGKNRTMSL